ncbi:MAG: hypothetical protein ACTSWY_02665 [Promethearchaeota archaeon]
MNNVNSKNQKKKIDISIAKIDDAVGIHKALLTNLVEIKADEKENKLMNNLNILFVIGLAAQILTLFYRVDDWDPIIGIIQVGVSLIISVILILILRKSK